MPRQPFAKFRLTVFAILSAVVLISPPTRADEAKTTFNIPAQDLSAALREFARQSNLEILFSSEVAQGKKSKGVKGDLTADAALTKLLVGTGLVVAKSANGTTLVTTPDAKEASGKSGPPIAPSGAINNPHQNSPGNEAGLVRIAQLEEVLVTGTRIGGVVPVGAPILTLDRTEIERSGYTTAEELIQSIPQNFRGGAAGASADTTFSSGANRGYNSAFGSGVNLRGLGATATLVLVNGHRVASSGSGFFTDISSIPVSNIERVEVLTDGASAIYGSDAIAGVINIILKKESDGVETEGRYGATTDNGLTTYGADLQLGNRWTGGGLTFGADFSHQSSLDDSARPFTSSVPSPTSIFPAYDQASLSVAAHHGFGDRLEVHSDAQYTTTTRTDFYTTTPPPKSTREVPTINRWSASIGGSYQISDSWSLRFDSSGGVEGVSKTSYDVAEGVPSTFLNSLRETSRFSDQNAVASGHLFDLPGGAVKLAAGASYLAQSFSHQDRGPTLASVFQFHANRNVTAGFGEFLIPVIGEPNAVQGIKKLTLSAAVRHDHYSDFGDTTNPKVGISWFPKDTFELRGAYSTSFRAPAAGTELFNSNSGTRAIVVIPFPGPDGALVPLVLPFGAKPGLKPETAKNWTVGFDYKPSSVRGLQVSVNYYDIVYSKQLATAPLTATALSDPALAAARTHYPDSAALQAFVNDALSHGAIYIDTTGGLFGSNPLAMATYLYDLRTQNLSSTDTTGFDVTAIYPAVIGSDRIDTRLDATYITKLSSQLTSGSPSLSQVDTVGYPARLRLRGQAAWTHRNLDVSITANFVSDYRDTSAVPTRSVGSFETFDLVARYDFSAMSRSPSHGAVATVAATNIFNRLPPYVSSGAINFTGSHYDPANASPLGRLISVSIAKHW